MAKDNEVFGKEERFAKAELPAGLTVDQMTRLLLKTMEENATANQRLAEALLESRKPYVDPKVVEQKQRELEERRRMIEMEVRLRASAKKICPHKRENGTWNIKWMQHSNNIVLGVCGTCRSEFDARIPADLAILRQDLKSIKSMGRAGPHAMKGMIIDS